MLVVFERTPCATPAETMFLEELVAKIVQVDDVTPLGSLRLDGSCRFARKMDARIPERIYVNCHTLRMLRHASCVGLTIVETRRVVCLHRQLVIAIKLVNETDRMNRIFLIVKFAENINQILRDKLVTYKFAVFCVTFLINVQNREITKVRTLDRTPLGI